MPHRGCGRGIVSIVPHRGWGKGNVSSCAARGLRQRERVKFSVVAGASCVARGLEEKESVQFSARAGGALPHESQRGGKVSRAQTNLLVLN